MITCEEVSRLVSESQERELTLRQKTVMRIHFALCILCRRFRDQIAFLREIMDRYQAAVDDNLAIAGEAALSSEARENLLKTLSGKLPGED